MKRPILHASLLLLPFLAGCLRGGFEARDVSKVSEEQGDAAEGNFNGSSGATTDARGGSPVGAPIPELPRSDAVPIRRDARAPQDGASRADLRRPADAARPADSGPKADLSTCVTSFAGWVCMGAGTDCYATCGSTVGYTLECDIGGGLGCTCMGPGGTRSCAIPPGTLGCERCGRLLQLGCCAGL